MRRFVQKLLISTGALGVALFLCAAEPPRADLWSVQPIARPAVPQIRNLKTEIRNPVDAFLFARLQKEGLTFAPPADRATLIRRATFDLHGLPPTPEEIESFVNDRSPDAWPRLIDRLLASPRYGERWGRHWLDVVRFAESQGFERDKPRDHSWRYRDYVIQSFNSDKPYDQFMREQVAGDVVPGATRDSIVATGFLVGGPYDEAGNSSVSASLRARIREEELEDTLSAVGQTFLGMTVNCARCHDHKFDPIPQRDYYRLKSVFDGVKHGDRSILTPVEQQRHDERLAQVERDLKRVRQEIADLEQIGRDKLAPPAPRELPATVPAPMARWTFESDARDAIGKLHGTLRGPARVANGRLILNGKGAFVETEPLAAPLREKTLEVWVAVGDLNQQGGGVMSVQIEGGRTFDAIVFGERAPRRWMAGSEFFRRTRNADAADETAGPRDLVHLAIVYSSDNQIAVYRNGKPYLKPYRPEGDGSSLRTYPPGESRILFGLRHTGAGNGFFTGEIEEARLYDRALTPEQVAVSFKNGVATITLADLLDALPTEQRQRWHSLQSERTRLRQRQEAEKSVPLAYAANPKQPEPTAVLIRGEPDKRGEIVSAGGLSAIKSLSPDFGLKPDAPEAERRLHFAGWLGDPANPLPARVMVNRLWHYHFGRGLVDTPNDFGANGGRPSHPDLLDWLAAEFIRRGWSIKAMHRLIMTSAAYQQSSHAERGMRSAELKDTENRWLWHFAPRRLEAEAIRDAMLAISGRLNTEIGGPSFRPFKATVFNSTFYTLVDEDRPEFNRRTVYRMVVSSAKDPLLESFDCPEPSVKAPRRSATTTPLQALALMNNPFVQRQAKYMAERVRGEAGDDPQKQIGRAFRLAVGREPSRMELERSLTHVREQGLAELCWVLMNASEFLYVK